MATNFGMADIHLRVLRTMHVALVSSLQDELEPLVRELVKAQIISESDEALTLVCRL